jgi:GNAT superfamily N-acetyltransferase
MNRSIRIITDEPLEASLEIVRKAFGTVAKEFGFTEQNAPRYTAFTTLEMMEELRGRPTVFWGLYEGEKQIGFVAVEKEKDGRYWMKRLAVLPEYRHGGSGRALINTVIAYTRKQGEKKLYLGTVYDETELINWYLKMGFKLTQTFKVPDLPFTVAFMEKDL